MVLWAVVLVALCLVALVTRSLAWTWARRVAQVALALVALAVIWELFGAVASRLPAGFRSDARRDQFRHTQPPRRRRRARACADSAL